MPQRLTMLRVRATGLTPGISDRRRRDAALWKGRCSQMMCSHHLPYELHCPYCFLAAMETEKLRAKRQKGSDRRLSGRPTDQRLGLWLNRERRIGDRRRINHSR